MSAPRRFLFVAPPLVGHVHPMASIAHELALRGHRIGWVLHPGMRRLLRGEATLFDVAEDDRFAAIMAAVAALPGQALPEAFASYYRDVVGPLATTMRANVDAAVAAFAPDAMVVDQHALAGVFAARRMQVPWVTSAPSAQLLIRTLESFAPARQWLAAQLEQRQVEAGLVPVEWPDVSPHLVLLYTSAALAGADFVAPPQFRLVGPCLAHRDPVVDFPWDELRAMPRVMLSLGTIVRDHGRRFAQTVIDALGDAPVQVIVAAPVGLDAAVPANFIVRPWLPQTKLLPLMDAVITHGGSTVNEALAFGLPLLVAPVTSDNFVMAQKVVEAGAGLRIKFRRIGPAELRRAVDEVLENVAYRRAAIAIQASFAAAGGTIAAANHIEALGTWPPGQRRG